MRGKRGKIAVLSDVILELMDRKPDDIAFSIPEIAQFAVGPRSGMGALAEKWVSDGLARARQRIERTKGMTFIPVTEYYFEHWYGSPPPDTFPEAIKCVAGVKCIVGEGFGVTAGIRRLWSGHKNDLLAYVWINQGYKSGGNKLRKTTDRLLQGFNNGEVSKKEAQATLVAGYSRVMPTDRATLLKLLPQAKGLLLIGDGAK